MAVSDSQINDKDAILRRLVQDAEAEPETIDAYDWIDNWVQDERERLTSVWKEHTSGQNGGRSFWHHAKTGEKTWHRPAGVQGSDWIRHATQDGKVFWRNSRTKEKTWKNPQTSWACYTDTKSGKPFWVNHETGQKTWKAPLRPAPASVSDPSGSGGSWVRIDAGGKTCWYNTETKQKQWHQPDVLLDERNVDRNPSLWSLCILMGLIAAIGLSR